jgi:DNA invertase Pin-like site-specific DNA recombinase
MELTPLEPYWISYTRISDKRDVLIDQKIENQHRVNVVTIETTGAKVLHLSDRQSGMHGKRGTGWHRALNLIENDDNCIGLLAMFQDRLSRDVEDTARLVRICSQRNKHIVIPSEAIDTRQTGWTRHIKASFFYKSIGAQEYAEAVAEKLRAKIKSVHDAMLPWGKLPYGLARDGSGTQAYIVAGADMRHVIRALTIYAAGASYDEGIKRLNDEGIPFRDRAGNATKWTRESLRTVVGNVLIYAGYFQPLTGWDAKASRVILEGEGSFVERYARACGAVPSPRIAQCIPLELADAVIERRWKNQNVGRKSLGWTPLLTPLAFHRGKKMRAARRSFGNFYETRTAGIMVDADKADDFVVQRLSEIEFPPTMLEMIRASMLRRVSDDRLKSLGDQLASIDRRKAALVDLLLDERIDKPAYRDRFDSLQSEREKIMREMNRPTEVEVALSRLATLGKTIALMTPRNRKASIADLFDAIHFNDEGMIERVEVKAWALQAFREIRDAYNATTPILPKVGVEPTLLSLGTRF